MYRAIASCFSRVSKRVFWKEKGTSDMRTVLITIDTQIDYQTAQVRNTLIDLRGTRRQEKRACYFMARLRASVTNFTRDRFSLFIAW